MPKKESIQIARPVWCHICGFPMVYYGDKNHEPEFKLEVKENNKHLVSFYVHKRCFNEENNFKETK